MAGYKSIKIGDRFGRLTVTGPDQKSKKRRKFICLCDCGNSTSVYSFHLSSRFTRSCGCLMAETRSHGTKYRHGHAKTGRPSPTYTTWANMIRRCFKTDCREFKWYGGRGITVCERWRSFENFLADMGERPAALTLDRIDNDGNYEPSNCRWATVAVQLANRRNPQRASQ